MTKEVITERFKKIQDSICLGLEEIDGKSKFEEDLWERDGGGGGRTRIIRGGNIFEKGGVNFSAVHGKLPAVILKEFGTDKEDFYATGVSIVIHPNHPLVPIIHMNIRYFEMEDGPSWFGGGIDLTPHYISENEAKHFHGCLKTVCDAHDSSYYPEFKKWADDYFYIPHRKETRGIGGIFFDKLTPNENRTKEDLFNFVTAVGESFVDTYRYQVEQSRGKPYTEQQKQWQLVRRGRYVEFNLVYDRGTKFGLETSGRIESILMSLPQDASWLYNFIPEEGSEEAKTLSLLRKGINW
jgi:coproporphyrinogen III oxidase